MSPSSPPAASSSGAAPSGATTRRLMKELENLRALRPSPSDRDDDDDDDDDGIERLAPTTETSLLHWSAVIHGRGLPGGYHAGRWLLHLAVPATYPLAPPAVVFATPVVHPNVALATGEVCLDLLRVGGGADAGGAWTPAYTLRAVVRAVRMLLACPGLDSPLNVDVAALLRGGDGVGARRLVELWVGEERYEGE
ncbi:hypothetical protein P8C59_004068 [Phyllachora maydis]|uniref:UBC core domain-containing protein n=1 Tax=Phyllachora maydis TaxID=1825666 RepID=A0AAD9I2M0_9PEZI|nr:hypothetical protein P8C59_004068 [Phyllachora maydis]